jgi:glycosyltransferase involved in cell wall biosynthesis
MQVSIILCTYNRCQLLRHALDSLAASDVSDLIQWEVLVIDNNSNDATREVTQEFCDRYQGHFRYIFESRQGKSFALNAGVRAADGDILAFVDDDATVEPSWLKNLTAALLDGDWCGVGGRILLEWPSTLPPWVSTEGPRSRHCFPGFDQGNQSKALVGPPFGANMAFRRYVFEKYGEFRTDLGPSAIPGIPRPGEDTEFARRLISAGERLRYEPTAVVHHPVPEDRINKNYFLSWWYDNGRTNAREYPIELFRESTGIAAWTFRWMRAFKPQERFYCKLVLWEKAGKLSEHYRLWSRSLGKKNKLR